VRRSNRSCARGEARLLDRPPGSPALLIEGIASTSEGMPIELGRTFVRGDRTRYYVERVVIRPRWTRPDGDEEQEESIDEIASRAAAHGHH
jgi:hypothetical protein